jgi:chromosome segregation ATPase
MDPLLVVLCTTIGALTGTSVGILVLRRKLRPPISETELAKLRTKLGSNEVSLAEATATLVELRKQITIYEENNQRNSEALRDKQQQLDVVSADAQQEMAQRLVAEKNARELSVQFMVVTEERDKLDARMKEGGSLLEEKESQVNALETQLHAGKKQVQELTAHVGRLTSEAGELKGNIEQESRRRVFLEAQLSADQERLKLLMSQVAEMQTERQRFEQRLQEERQSARKGIDLLLQAQEKLSHMFNSAAEASQVANGNGHTAHEIAAAEGVKEGEVVTIKVRQAS